MYISLLTALTFAGAREDLTRVEIDTLTALSTWSGVRQIDAEVARIAARAHYSEDATKKALASLETRDSSSERPASAAESASHPSST